MMDTGYSYIVDIDLSKFFDRINHDLLMNRIACKIKDKRVLKLIGRYLRCGARIKGNNIPSSIGVPQGGPLSPLLANIMLDDFDKELEMRGHHFVRYADDFLIVVKSRRAAQRVLTNVTRFLERKLKLVINQKKSKITTPEECEYLGFIFKNKRITFSKKSLENFKYNIRRLTARSWGIWMDERIRKLSEYIRGWMGYYALSKYYRPIPILDEWIRRRIRMCYIKQWRFKSTRIQKLIKLGAPNKQAIGTGISDKGYWRLAKTFGTNAGLNNAYLKEKGLVSIKELWIQFHYPK